MKSSADSSLRFKLSDDRRAALVKSIKSYFDDEFDEPISDFRADGLLDFFLAELGPTVYNQGVQDACGFMQEKLTDLEGEIYQPERQGPR